MDKSAANNATNKAAKMSLVHFKMVSINEWLVYCFNLV